MMGRGSKAVWNFSENSSVWKRYSPVLEIGFGPPTAESKNLKNYVNCNLGDLFLWSPALWSSQNVFSPPNMVAALLDFKDWAPPAPFLH